MVHLPASDFGGARLQMSGLHGNNSLVEKREDGNSDGHALQFGHELASIGCVWPGKTVAGVSQRR